MSIPYVRNDIAAAMEHRKISKRLSGNLFLRMSFSGNRMKPTNINIPEVASIGIVPTSGIKTKLANIKIAVKIDVRPVLPPTFIPTALETKTATLDAPKKPPIIFPIPST